MVQHLFLDFDGVIHRSATRQLRESFSRVVKGNLDLPDLVINQLFSSIQAMPSPAALWATFEWLGITDVSHAVAQVHDCSPVGWQDQPDAEGIAKPILSLIQTAREEGMSVDVISTAGSKSPRLTLALDALADFEVGRIAIQGRSKADPETYRFAVRAKHCSRPSQCVLVDDSVFAVSAACTAGVRGYLSTSDSHSADIMAGCRNWTIEEIIHEVFKNDT